MLFYIYIKLVVEYTIISILQMAKCLLWLVSSD